LLLKKENENTRGFQLIEKELREKLAGLEVERKATLGSLARSHAALSKAETQHRSQIDALNETLATLSDSQLTKKVDELNSEILGLRSNLTVRDEKNEILDEELNEFKSKLKDADASIQDLKFSLAESDIQLEETRKKLQASEQTIKDMEIEMIDAANKSDEREELKHDLQRSETQFHQEITRLKGSLEALTKECDELKNQLAANVLEMEQLRLSGGQKELITSLIFNLKTEVATLKVEDVMMSVSIQNHKYIRLMMLALVSMMCLVTLKIIKSEFIKLTSKCIYFL
jgi:chromosome segregation ATPase